MQYVRHLPKYKTKVRHEGNTTIVRLWNTDIVRFSPFCITLNTGGWFSVTTKKRMNQVSEFFELGFRVVQRKGEWSVLYANENPMSFMVDSITFSRHYQGTCGE